MIHNLAMKSLIHKRAILNHINGTRSVVQEGDTRTTVHGNKIKIMRIRDDGFVIYGLYRDNGLIEEGLSHPNASWSIFI